MIASRTDNVGTGYAARTDPILSLSA
jgi:hypothetical protein